MPFKLRARRFVLLLLWVCVCLFVYAGFLRTTLSQGSDPERLIVFILEMIVLTFPSGYFGNILLAEGVVLLLGAIDIHLSFQENVFLQWFFMMVSGGVQWFVFVPWVWKKLVIKTRGATPPPGVGS